MKKNFMRDVIIRIMVETKETSVAISSVIYVAEELASTGMNERYEVLDINRAYLLQTVMDVGIFEIGEIGRDIKLKSPEDIEQYEQDCIVSEEFKEKVKECVKKLEQPLLYTCLNVDQAAKIEEEIKNNTVYINWLFKMIDNFKTFSSKDYMLAKNGKELAYFTMISNFYHMVNRYCKDNIIGSYTSFPHSHIVSYMTKEKMRYLKITRFEYGANVHYVINECDSSPIAAYFPDVAVGAHCASYKARVNKLSTIRKTLTHACKMHIPYSRIKCMLDQIYGIGDDD